MKKEREGIIKHLTEQVHINGHIIGAMAGGGMMARCLAEGGADFLVASSSARFRQMGRGSLACYLSYANSNDMVLSFASQEIQPLVSGIPLLLGFQGTDPYGPVEKNLAKIKAGGFGGICNYPTVGLVDGAFGEALKQEGMAYAREVEAIGAARQMDLLTMAMVFNKEQALQMLDAGADMICVHMGPGSSWGEGRSANGLEKAAGLAQEVFKACQEARPQAIRLIYGGPAMTPIHAHYLYVQTSCQGVLGEGCFDWAPTEHAVLHTVRSYKSSDSFGDRDPMVKVLRGNASARDYAAYVKTCVNYYYMSPIYLNELAVAAHISPSYLSGLFKKEVGLSFSQYLVRFRINKACQFLKEGNISVKKAGEMAGYDDPVQFSKMFKKHTGQTAKEYQQLHKGQEMPNQG